MRLLILASPRSTNQEESYQALHCRWKSRLRQFLLGQFISAKTGQKKQVEPVLASGIHCVCGQTSFGELASLRFINEFVKELGLIGPMSSTPNFGRLAWIMRHKLRGMPLVTAA
jgi:hypothetical protein